MCTARTCILIHSLLLLFLLPRLLRSSNRSFPIDTSNWEDFPLLGPSGAYDFPRLTFSLEDFDRVVRFAADRGVRVVPEIDSPAHSQSWAQGYPELQPCESSYTAVLDPLSETVYDALDTLVGKLASRFPDRFVHLGIDEITFDCWNESTQIREWIVDKGYTPENKEGFKALARLYIQRAQEIVRLYNRTTIVWQEAFDDYGEGDFTPTPPPENLSPNNTVVQVWKYPGWNWANMTGVTQKNFRALRSDPWYLGPATDWSAFYQADPVTNKTCIYSDGGASRNCTCPEWDCFDLVEDSPELLPLVLGGEACQWGEQVDAHNLESQIWPAASAVAERLWSPEHVNVADEALPRLLDMRCRLVRRGIGARPLQPGFCPGMCAVNE